jgi:hypothetical protein
MADNIPEVIWFTAQEPEKVLYLSPSFELNWGFPVENGAIPRPDYHGLSTQVQAFSAIA